jgi:hypothetical protein
MQSWLIQPPATAIRINQQCPKPLGPANFRNQCSEVIVKFVPNLLKMQGLLIIDRASVFQLVLFRLHLQNVRIRIFFPEPFRTAKLNAKWDRSPASCFQQAKEHIPGTAVLVAFTCHPTANPLTLSLSIDAVSLLSG